VLQLSLLNVAAVAAAAAAVVVLILIVISRFTTNQTCAFCIKIYWAI